MRIKFLLIFFLLFNKSRAEDPSQFISLIAPPAVYANKPYTAYLTTSNFDSDIDIAIKLRAEEGFYKIRVGQFPKLDYQIRFDNAGNNTKKGPRSDPDKIRRGDEIGYPLKIVARQDNKCISREIFLVYVQTDYHLFIQMDKPFYKPGDEIKYRIVVFDYDTKPVGINQIDVRIHDAEGNLIENQRSLAGQSFQKYGLFEGTLPIDDDPNLGNWTISARINNNVKMSNEKKFKVEKVVLPFFEVVIESEDVFHYDEKFMGIRIFGRYAFGEYAKGTAQLKITNDVNNATLFQNRYRIETFKDLEISFRNDLMIHFMAKPSMLLNIQVDFLDSASNSYEKKVKQIQLHSQKNHFIEVLNPYPLEDNLEFEFDVVIRDYRGKVINAGSEPVKVSCTIVMNRGPNSVKSEHKPIKNSAAHFKIEGYKGVKELRIEVEYLRAKTEVIIKPGLEVSYALRVSSDTAYVEDFDEDLQLTVEYSEGIYEIVAMILGRHKIVYSKTFDCYGDYSCTFLLDDVKNYYNEMKPEAKLAVYSVQHYDRKVLFGTTMIKLSGLSANKLDFIVPKKSTPKAKHTVPFTTLPESVVSFLAIDKKLTFVRSGHDITKKDVIDILTNTKRYVYLKNADDKEVIYDKYNHNFVINFGLDKWRTCKSDETALLDKIYQQGISVRTQYGGQYTTGTDVDPTHLNLGDGDDPADFTVRKNFPETWIWDSMEVKSGEGQLDLTIPDSMTSWLFTAFSINKEGFALADPQEIVSSQEFFVELKLPYSIRFGEILNLEVMVFNFMPEQYAGPVDVELKVIAQHRNHEAQFEFVKYISYESCQTQAIEGPSQTLNFQLPHKSGLLKKFKIKPLVTEKVSIRVEAKARNQVGRQKVTFTDTIVKTLLVENQGVAYYSTKNFEFKLKNNVKYESHAFHREDVRIQAIDLSAVVTGSMMGPSLSLESSIIMPYHCGEQSMSRYVTTVRHYAYLKKLGRLSHDTERYAVSMLRKAYQNLMGYKNWDGGFHTWIFYHQYGAYGYSSSTWMTAYAAQILSSAMRAGIDPINWDIIRNALSFCAGKQNSNGDFQEVGGYVKNPNPIDSGTSRKVRFTAFVTIPFLLNRNYIPNFYSYGFNSNIKRALDYIEEQLNYNNYAASIAAFALALDNRSASERLLEKLNKESESDGEKTYWNIAKGTYTSTDTQVLISAYVAMAYIQRDQVDKATPIIKWLMMHRNAYGGYSDSHSSAVALEALTMMATKLGTYADTSINFEFIGNSAKKLSYYLGSSNSLKPHFMEMPKKTTNITIVAQGSGYGVVTTYYEYFIIVKEISTTFRVDASASLESGDYAKINVCFRRNLVNPHSDMVIIEFSLVSGYVYVAEKTEPMRQDSNIRIVEILRGGTVVNLYYEAVPAHVNKCVYLYAKKMHNIDNERPASVKIYEYDRRDETFASAFYNIGKPGCV